MSHDPDAPVEIRIVPNTKINIPLNIPGGNEIHLSHSNPDISFNAPVHKQTSSKTNQKTVNINSKENLNNKDSSAINENPGVTNINVFSDGTYGISYQDNTPTSEDTVVLGDASGSTHSIKIVTLDKTYDGKTSETRKTEKLQSLVPNTIPKYLSRVSERCDEFSCENGGTCVDDGTSYRDKVRCDCPLSTQGARCEHGKFLESKLFLFNHSGNSSFSKTVCCLKHA